MADLCNSGLDFSSAALFSSVLFPSSMEELVLGHCSHQLLHMVEVFVHDPKMADEQLPYSADYAESLVHDPKMHVDSQHPDHYTAYLVDSLLLGSMIGL